MFRLLLISLRPAIFILALLITLLLPSVVRAQGAVSPDKVASIAKMIHDTEGWRLGSTSSRETRNEFWAFVIGVVHWGHPAYNPTPDPSWCLKNARNRPQTDDVATQCQSRLYWDCIGGVGADGYEDKFACNGHGNERLPADQDVWPPPKPKGWDGNAPTPGPVPPSPGPGPAPAPTVNLQPALDALAGLQTQVLELQAAVQQATAYAKSASIDAYELNKARIDGTFRVVLSDGTVQLCMVGRVPKAFGGSSEVVFCPRLP